MKRLPRHLPALASVIIFLLSVRPAVAQSSSDPCVLPLDLQPLVAAQFPRTKIVTVEDLSDDHKSLFEADHRGKCPGLVQVDFYGDGKPTLALALTTVTGKYRQTNLILAHKRAERWTLRYLDKSDGAIAVTWSEQPATYESVYRDQTIAASHPVIIFCGYNSFAIVYAWINHAVAKVWLED